MRHLRFLLCVLITACASAPRSVDTAESTLAITDVTVIDVESGELRPSQHVLIQENRIVRIGPASAIRVPAGVRSVDGRGGYLIPGLWDMHVHAWDRAMVAPLLLANGVIGVREMGSGIGRAQPGHRSPLGWREDLRTGAAPGPRLIAAFAILDGGDSSWYRNAPFFKVVGTRAAAGRWVDSLATLQADFVKVYRSLAPEVYEAIVDRARQHGLPVEGHVPSRVGVARAIALGQRTVEHLTDILVSISEEEEYVRSSIAEAIGAINTQSAAYAREHELTELLLRTSSDRKLAELSAELAARRVWQIPTLVVLHDPRFDDPAAEPHPARIRALPPLLQMFVRQYEPITDSVREMGSRRFARELEVVGALHRADVPILAGTDLANPWIFPGFSLHDELQLLVRAGLSSLDALRAATLNPARYLNATDSLGAVREGRLADLVLLEANPLENIGNTTRIRAVIMNGTLFDRPALDAMLEPPSGQ